MSAWPPTVSLRIAFSCFLTDYSPDRTARPPFTPYINKIINHLYHIILLPPSQGAPDSTPAHFGMRYQAIAWRSISGYKYRLVTALALELGLLWLVFVLWLRVCFHPWVFECVTIRCLAFKGHLGLPSHIVVECRNLLTLLLQVRVLFLYKSGLVAGLSLKLLAAWLVLVSRLFLYFDLHKQKST